MEQDPVSTPRASASEIEFDAIIGGGRLVDPLCFTSSLEVESVLFLTRMQDLYLLNGSGYVFHTVRICIIRFSGAR